MTSPNRRDVLKAAAGSLLLPLAGARATPLDLPSLRDLGAAKGLEIGSCHSGASDAFMRPLLRQQVGLITPEWCLQPNVVKPAWEEPPRFTEPDAIRAFARSAGLSLHGHSLFWYLPIARAKWADGLPQASAELRYGTYLDEVAGHFREMKSWDVVNEIVPDAGPDLIRRDPLLDAHGLPFVAFLFRRAREIAPQAKLCLNENNLEGGESWCVDKQTRLLAVIDRLRDLGAPIDAIGLQSHLSARVGVGVETTLAFCDKLAARGLDVYVSELDVNDYGLMDPIPERDLAVADLYSAYLTGVLSHRTVKRVAFWGLSDAHHWLVKFPGDHTRAPGLGRPAPFDAALQPKAAFYAVVEALRRAPAR